ncbi:MAG: hypothetical protein GX279_10340 [Clostridiaceae bacterium]|jgi:hypothetical protein|nr:hypothetical protein [Clostridiaceae bacterium]
MKRSGNCGSCARGIRIKVNSDILCRIHGAVSKDYRCSRYIRKVAQWSSGPSSAPSASEADHIDKCIDCEYFVPSISSEEKDSSVGYCELFTVRHYNGMSKNACSRFRKKAQKNIS